MEKFYQKINAYDLRGTIESSHICSSKLCRKLIINPVLCLDCLDTFCENCFYIAEHPSSNAECHKLINTM